MVFGVVSRRFGVIFGRFGVVWGVLGWFGVFPRTRYDTGKNDKTLKSLFRELVYQGFNGKKTFVATFFSDSSDGESS